MPRLDVLYSWLVEGVYKKENKRRHLLAVRSLRPREDNAFEHDYLYSCLSILDTKAQALLAFDSILMAAASIALSLIPGSMSLGDFLIFSSLVASGTSSALCLSVVWIYWSDTSDLEPSDDLFMRLLAVRNRRTIGYRISWVIAQLATLLLVIGTIIERNL